MTMDLATALGRLAHHRTHNTRNSLETYQCGLVVINNNNAIKKMGEEGWDFLEQLALAAIDVRDLNTADQCLRHLSTQFPGSPRVECLQGIRMEASEPPNTALSFYEGLLKADPTQSAIWKRKISVLIRMNALDRAIQELKTFLATFYTDTEAWLELAEVYCACSQYTYALQSLSHALLLNPQNPFYVLQAAETAYTADDVPLSIKMFLMVIEMTSKGDDDPKAKPRGIAIRAWYGVQLCARRLTAEKRLPSNSDTPYPKHVEMVLELAEEKLRAVYSET